MQLLAGPVLTIWAASWNNHVETMSNHGDNAQVMGMLSKLNCDACLTNFYENKTVTS